MVSCIEAQVTIFLKKQTPFKFNTDFTLQCESKLFIKKEQSHKPYIAANISMECYMYNFKKQYLLKKL